jgi:hydrogenase maturation factor HypF (carbamoyltransferase family)
MAHNKAISQYLFNQGVLLNRDFPRGDAGICFGQLYLANIQ